ncbi:MAG: tetratricopeptide repeat protein [Planctomycetaceae bacterium]|nr:tetratricopeptide repeat protein [Planctomycetaceae bacterium]
MSDRKTFGFTMETEAFAPEQRIDIPRSPRRRMRWIAVWAVAVTALAIGGGLWWRSLQPAHRYARARQALQSGDHRTVIREARRLLETPGFEPQGRLLSGLLLARRNRPVEALQELQHAFRDEATAVEALTVAAGCFYALGRYAETIQTARSALASDEGALDARRWLAAAYYDLGAAADASLELSRISTAAPADSRPERLLGLIDFDNERFSQAVEHFREALRRDPQPAQRAEILGDLAESQVKLSRFEEALETLRQCDQTAATLTLDAACEEGLGQTNLAQDRLAEALKLDSEYLPAHLSQGALLLLLGRADEAVAVLERAVQLAPYSSQAHFQLSQAYRRQGKSAQAAKQLHLMTQTQLIEFEFAELNALASEKPNDADVRYRAGLLARKLGKPDLARMWFRAALAIEPDHAEALPALTDDEPSR